ncbi:MAG: hypothetical protein ABWY35_01995 [Pseudorhodoplanes sp.]
MCFQSNTERFVLAALLASSAVLSGCSDIYFDRREGIAPWSGNAVEQNKVVQMVDPWPPYANNRNIAFDGEVMGRAVARYRAGKVIPPCNPATSSVLAAACNANANNAVNINPPPAAQGQVVNNAPSTWAGPQKAQAQAQP